MKYIYNLTFKMVISATIALVICDFFNVSYGTVAAVIAILSIQNTKKQALKISKDRFLACVISIVLSSLIYKFLGTSFIVFGLFLLIFIPITGFLKIEVGMIAAVVLSNHIFVAEIINSNLLINEFLIMIIGIGVAFFANLIMPSFDEQYLKDKSQIEILFQNILLKMSNTLITHTVSLDEEFLIFELENKIFKSEKIASNIVNNKLLYSNTYYLDYILMRKSQFQVIKKMRKHFEKFYMTYDQTLLIANYTKEIAMSMSENNDCLELLKKLDDLKLMFRGMPLPKSREEFENRAQLLQFLNDIEDFLIIKKSFILNKNY